VKKSLLALLIVSLFVPLHASPMKLDASFSGVAVDGNGSGASYALSGTLTYLFDSDWVGGVGNSSLVDQTPTSLALNPGSTGATIFDESNTAITLNFWNGTLTSLVIGDIHGSGVQAGQDDFLVVMYGPGSFSGGFLMHTLEDKPTYFGLDNAISGSFSVSPAPVPDEGSTAWLIALAVAGLVTGRRRLA
jgi:hypothetical protein